MGGTDKSGNFVDGMEVFDSKTKLITKVVDDNNNWVKMPFHVYGSETCAVPLTDKNAFIVSGGL